MQDTKFDVAVIGYGPTGLTLAAALGKAGHSVVVIERWPTLYGLPRLSHIDDETARIVQAIADVDHALRDSDPILEYHFINAHGETLTKVGAGASLGPSGFPRDLSIYQPDIETAIDDTVRGLTNVVRLLGTELIAIESGQEGVSLTVASHLEGTVSEERRIQASYVVGCDGARSAVRNALAVDVFEHDFEECWLNIDTEILRPLPEKYTRTVQCCDPSRGHMYMPIGKNRLRFEMAVLKGEDAEPYAERAFAWDWLKAMHGLGPEDVRIIRQVIYRFGARVAKQWRVGRVLLAGDAAHTMPPYLGQGACSGMRDGFNLAWKFDLILRGVSSDEILDSFEIERRPHVAAITKAALALGRVANEHDPERARIRDEHLKSNPPPKPTLPNLTTGIIDFAFSSLAGTIFPQGYVRFHGQEGRFDTVVGNGFILLSLVPIDEELGAERLRALDRIPVKRVALARSEFEDPDGLYKRFFAENGITAVLARPDFVIFGTASTDSSVSHLVDRLLEKLSITEHLRTVAA